MTTEIRVPALGESVTEATIAQWMKKVGEQVAKDEALVELETDKVAVEVNAPADGVLASIDAEVGATVGIGALLGTIDAGAKAAAAPAKAAAPKTEPAPTPKAEPAPAPKPASAAEAAPQSPAVRRHVEENALDPATIPATGRDGRLTKADVLDAAAKATTPAAPAAPVAPIAASSAPRADHPREERVRMTRLRKTIARRLKEAQNTAAMLTTFNEVDMTAVMELRSRYKDVFEKKHGIRLGFMSFFVKAAIAALKDVPSVNGEIDGDDIVYKNHYDIGVAVSAPHGLVVPVLRDADQRSFAGVELEIDALGRKARDGKLSLEDLSGGTFTISNGGVFGSLMSTPILNPPQSAILGMHKIQDRPMAIGKAVEIRPMMYLALSYDHRLIDGREAVTALVRIKECIEDPTRLILDL